MPAAMNQINLFLMPDKNNPPFCLNKSLKNLSGEKWKEIPYTEGYYLVSNYGRVKSLARYVTTGNPPTEHLTKDKILALQVSKQKNRYTGDHTLGLLVTYQFNKQKVRPMVRRLVYEIFVQPVTGEDMTGKFVYHLDGDPFNLHESNLALTNRNELRKSELRNERFIPPAFKANPEKNRKHLLKMNKTKRRAVIQYTIDGKKTARFASVTSAAQKTGISIASISSCARGERLQTKGIVWRFEPETYNGEFRYIKPKTEQVVQFTIDGRKVKSFSSVRDASRQTGISASSIA